MPSISAVCDAELSGCVRVDGVYRACRLDTLRVDAGVMDIVQQDDLLLFKLSPALKDCMVKTGDEAPLFIFMTVRKVVIVAVVAVVHADS